jgi:hypothetical protein
MLDRRKLPLIALVLVVLAMGGFGLFRYLVIDDIEGGGLEFEAKLSGAKAQLKVRSTFLEKGDVQIVDARLDGQQTLDKLPFELGEVGPWKQFDLGFPASKGPGPHKLELVAKFKTLFSQGAMHRTLTLP